MSITLPKFITACTFIVCGFGSPLVLAHNQPAYGSWSIATNLDHINIDSEAANRPDVMVDDSATALGVAGEYLFSGSDMAFAVGLNYIMYNDNNEFSQYVEDNWNDDWYDDWDDGSYEESDATAFMLFAEVGPKIYFGPDELSFFSVRGGASVIFDSTRSISFCSDCYSEDINLDGGLYGALGIGHSFSRFDLSLQFQQYFTGDIDNSLRLKAAFNF
jgi:hypothetical protein